MKKISITCAAALSAMLIAACGAKSHEGIYVANWKNEFSIANDTIIIRENIVIKRTGYQKIRSGNLQPKKWSVRRWILNGPYSPVIELGNHQITLGSTVYKLIKP